MPALEHIPDRVLREEGTRKLREWLTAHGTTLTLYDLDQERRRRGIESDFTRRTNRKAMTTP